MKNIWVWLVVLVAVIGGGVWWYQSSQNSALAIPDTTGTQTQLAGTPGVNDTPGADVNVGVGATKTVTVTYNGDAFSPKTITVNKGDTVNFVSSGTQMWVASDPHPTHQGYSGTTRSQHCPDTAGTAFDQCSPGASYSFTFQKTGSWGYHDHLNDNVGGTVIVQ